MQATIARNMVASKTSAPHFYVTSEVGMDAALGLRETLNASLGEEGKIGINDIVIKAVALALHKFPEVNASYRDGQIEYHKRINVGIAVAVTHGLIVPVLRDADRKTLLEIAREAGDLIERTRTSRLAPAEWEGGTITVSNLGMFDVEEFAAIITPPQSAILAVASIKPTPVVVDEQIKVERRMRITISADHRVFYGATAAEFLQEVKRLLENPFRLLL
jgi:pyruvate dehydrogenase E2 component (dihydrolipoamide acetyltransferase)